MKLPETRRHKSNHGTIKLRYRARSKSLVYEQMGGNQSAVDEGGVSLDSYIHALYGLVCQRSVKKVLMIGCGGGALGTMLAKTSRLVSIVDIDKESFVLAKRYFGLPRMVECFVDDGLSLLQKTRRRFDAIIIDAFVGEKIPVKFTEEAFFRAVDRCLRSNGFSLMNVCLEKKSDRTADKLASGFAQIGMGARLLDSPGGERNAIVLAGQVKDLRPPKLHITPRIEADRVTEELGEMRFRRRRAAK